MPYNNETLLIKNVRVAYPHLFEKYGKEGDEKYSIKLLLEPDRHAREIEWLRDNINSLVKQKYGVEKLPADKICVTRGEDKVKDFYEGYLVVDASNRDEIVVLSADGRSKITEQRKSPIYAGCRINAKVKLWPAKNHKYIGCEIIAVQFNQADTPIESGGLSYDEKVDGFEAVEEQSSAGEALQDGDLW